MTRRGGCDIISELSERRRETNLKLKKLEKSFQNPLTKASVCDILYKLPINGVANPKGTAKKLQKKFKKPLDKGKRM